MKSKKYLIPVSLIVLVVLVASLYNNIVNKKEDLSGTYYYLGTVNEITILKEKKSKSENVLEKSEKILMDVHNKMSSQQKDTEVNKINENAGIKPVTVSDETYHVVEMAIKYAKLNEGVFDPSIGAVSSLWQIGTDDQRIPTKDEIQDKVGLVDYSKIELSEENKSVYLKEKGMKIDLGAIAKGYSADLIAEMLTENDIKSAIVNLGGNVFVVGKNVNGKAFKVGIQAPYETHSASIGYVQVESTSVVTSGVYERYIKEGDTIYHHMLDPKTGYPFENNLNSVSIISKKSIDGDALSTSTYGLGLEKGMKFIESQKDVDAIFITKDKKVYTTSSLKGKFFLTDDTYTLFEN